EELESGVDANGTAFIEVRGSELYEPELKITTRYELAPGQRSLVISTTLENKKTAPIEGLDLGDAIEWGGAEKVIPGRPLGFKGDATSPWIGAAGREVSYGILGLPEAEGAPDLVSKSGTAWSNVIFGRGVSLAPSKKATYRRALVIAPRGDTLGVA